MIGNRCAICSHHTVDYEFDTEYMCTVAVEKCILKNKLFGNDCKDFKELE